MASRLCAHFNWNPLKLFIKKKIANELPIEIQCMLSEEAKKTSFPWYENLILYPMFHLRVRYVLTNLLSVYRSNPLSKVHVEREATQATMLTSTPCSFKTVPFAYPLIKFTENCRKLCVTVPHSTHCKFLIKSKILISDKILMACGSRNS